MNSWTEEAETIAKSSFGPGTRQGRKGFSVKSLLRLGGVMLAALAALILLPARPLRAATTITVTSASQLSTAITSAASGDTIQFGSNVTLSADLPAVQTSLTIDGSNGSGGAYTLSGNNTYRCFFIGAWTPGTATQAPVSVTIQNLTLSGCKAQGGAGSGNGGFGGGGAAFVGVTLSGGAGGFGGGAGSTMLGPGPGDFVPPPSGSLPLAAWLAMFGLLGLAVLAKFSPGGGRIRRLVPLATLALLLTFCAACGGGSSSLSSTTNNSSATPAGTYTLTVTGASGSLSHSAQVTLTVQ